MGPGLRRGYRIPLQYENVMTVSTSILNPNGPNILGQSGNEVALKSTLPGLNFRADFSPKQSTILEPPSRFGDKLILQ